MVSNKVKQIGGLSMTKNWSTFDFQVKFQRFYKYWKKKKYSSSNSDKCKNLNLIRIECLNKFLFIHSIWNSPQTKSDSKHLYVLLSTIRYFWFNVFRFICLLFFSLSRMPLNKIGSNSFTLITRNYLNCNFRLFI